MGSCECYGIGPFTCKCFPNGFISLEEQRRRDSIAYMKKFKYEFYAIGLGFATMVSSIYFNPSKNSEIIKLEKTQAALNSLYSLTNLGEDISAEGNTNLEYMISNFKSDSTNLVNSNEFKKYQSEKDRFEYISTTGLGMITLFTLVASLRLGTDLRKKSKKGKN